MMNLYELLLLLVHIIYIITGGNWPSTLALWLVDGLTLKSCIGAVGSCEKSAPLEEV